MCSFHNFLCLTFIPYALLHSSVAQALSTNRNNSSFPAIFVFGDSTVDPGNNDFYKTIFKSNFAPYGVDFDKSTPTGRFTNGRLPTDFVASYLGIKLYVPPYLDPSLSLRDLMTGVSFASAGSGYDPLTSTTNGVISMLQQLEYFAEYKARLTSSVGMRKANYIIKKAVYVISCGSNDFTQSRRLTGQSDYEYQLFILNLSHQFIQELFGHGAQQIAVVGLPPIGCLPSVITLNSASTGELTRHCVASTSSVAMGYNHMLKRLLDTMRPQVFYFDIYSSLFDQVFRPHKYGFDVVDLGCCGSGVFEEGILCNKETPICEDRSKYMFWDVTHPTERSYFHLFNAIRPAIDAIVHTTF